MKYTRTIFRIPTGLTLAALPEDVQAVIVRMLSNFVMPMPGTVEADGYVLCDALTLDTFDPATMPDYGIDWFIVGSWSDTGELLYPFNEEVMLKHLPEPEEGEKVLHEPHRWSGWQVLFGAP